MGRWARRFVDNFFSNSEGLSAKEVEAWRSKFTSFWSLS